MTVGLSGRLTLRAPLILTAAFVASAGVTLPQSVRRMVLNVTYTRGAAAGFPSILVDYSRDNVNWITLGIANGAVTASNEFQQTPIGQWELEPFGLTGPAGAGAVTCGIPLVLPPCAFVRVQCKETGSPANLGTLGITMDCDVDLS